MAVGLCHSVPGRHPHRELGCSGTPIRAVLVICRRRGQPVLKRELQCGSPHGIPVVSAIGCAAGREFSVQDRVLKTVG